MIDRKPNRYWTYDRCKDITLKCKNRNDLRNKYITVENLIYKNKWFELTEHLKTKNQ